MSKLTLDPEEFIEQLPPATKAAVEALRELQGKVRGGDAVVRAVVCVQ
jgi:hypothetical protein